MAARADLIDLEADETTQALCLEGARRELATITGLMEELAPLCKFGHVEDILTRAELCQEESWLAELKMRASLMLISGGISWDQLSVMAAHPARKEIFAHITHVQRQLADARQGKGAGVDAILDQHKPLMLT